MQRALGMVHDNRQRDHFGTMPGGEPVLLHVQDGPAAEHGDPDVDAGLIRPLGRPWWRRQGRRPEGAVHPELVGQQRRLGRFCCDPDLLQAGDVRPHRLEGR